MPDLNAASKLSKSFASIVFPSGSRKECSKAFRGIGSSGSRRLSHLLDFAHFLELIGSKRPVATLRGVVDVGVSVRILDHHRPKARLDGGKGFQLLVSTALEPIRRRIGSSSERQQEARGDHALAKSRHSSPHRCAPRRVTARTISRRRCPCAVADIRRGRSRHEHNARQGPSVLLNYRSIHFFGPAPGAQPQKDRRSRGLRRQARADHP